MILNSYIITYLVCSGLSLFIGITALVYAFSVWRKWDIASNNEDQYRLEKKVYLIITILCLGFFLRILMVPLWFITLHSMIISISGAMCLVGVHNINAPLSYIASGLKLIVPTLYVYWLTLNFLDRQVVSQPFVKQKLFFLAPLGILIFTETVFDAAFLFSVPPRQVSCCTSLFDVPRDNLPHIVTGSTWIWVVVFYCLFVLIISETIWFMIAQKRSLSSKEGWWFGRKSVMMFETMIIVFTIAVFVLSLHTKIAPLFLRLPFHHCIFCLGQEVWDAVLFFTLIYSGLTMLLVYFWIVSSESYGDVNPYLGRKMVTLLKWAGFLMTGGVVILSIHIGFEHRVGREKISSVRVRDYCNRVDMIDARNGFYWVSKTWS